MRNRGSLCQRGCCLFSLRPPHFLSFARLTASPPSSFSPSYHFGAVLHVLIRGSNRFPYTPRPSGLVAFFMQPSLQCVAARLVCAAHKYPPASASHCSLPAVLTDIFRICLTEIYPAFWTSRGVAKLVKSESLINTIISRPVYV